MSDRRGVELLRESVEQVAASLPAPSDRRVDQAAAIDGPWLRTAAVAAVVSLLILAYPAYLGLFELPRVREEAAARAIQPVGPAATYLVSMPRRDSALRGDPSGVERIEIRRDRPSLLLVELDPGSIPADVRGCTFELRRAEAPAVPRAWHLEAAELNHLLGLHEGVPLVLPAGLEPGVYELRSNLRGATGDEVSTLELHIAAAD